MQSFRIDMSFRPALLLFLLLLTVDAESEDQEYRDSPMCSHSNSPVDLSTHSLTEVPRNLPRSTQYLDLSHNNILQLSSEDLAGLTELCFLKITHNGLKFISPLAFQASSKVQVLNISFNALKTIPDFALPDLRVLDLSENLYESYSLGKSYTKLLNLTSLALGSSQATSLNLLDFAALRTIPLKKLQLGSGDEMERYELGSLAQLSALRELMLKITFCQNSGPFKNILEDLDRTHADTLTLVRLLPDLCDVSSDLSDGLKNLKHLSSLIFQDTWFNSSLLTKIAICVVQSSVKVLKFLNITFAQDTPEGIQVQIIPGYNKTGNIQAVTIDTIHHYQYNFPHISINASFLSHIVYLKFSGTGMSIMPCNLISAMSSLQHLDLTDNLLKEQGLWWTACSFSHMFPALRRLYLRNNKFEDLQVISNHTHEMRNLDTLDLSDNSIRLRGKSSWPSHLTTLSLSRNSLGDAVFDYLSPHIQSLNLSQMGITTLTKEVLSQMPDLSHLYLSSNSIKSLPPDLLAPKLEELHLDQNNINTFYPSSFKGLLRLRRLKAGNNPFACNCDLYWFVTSFNKSVLHGWPSDYTCSSPANLAGITLDRYRPGWVSCNSQIQAAISLVVILLVAVALGTVFHVCDGAWYLQMLWVWMRVKRRGHQGAKSLGGAIFQYHAFISYSQRDGEWVEAQLVPNLEAAQFKLCVHERDFVPGHWIIDNIINCVEGSYKTLFVLSQNFVRSEWCNYELFFAQHRAITVQQDSLVFILLEPISADSLPKKFMKLRTLLRQQTYLQWPSNERKQQVFWANLRAIIRADDKQLVLKDVAREITEMCQLVKDTD